jgi:hypothetical protein
LFEKLFVDVWDDSDIAPLASLGISNGIVLCGVVRSQTMSRETETGWVKVRQRGDHQFTEYINAKKDDRNPNPREDGRNRADCLGDTARS